METNTLISMLQSGRLMNNHFENLRQAVAGKLVSSPELVDSGREILQLIAEAKKQSEEYTNLAIMICVANDYDNKQDLVIKLDELRATAKRVTDSVSSLDAAINIPEWLIQSLSGINLDPEMPQ